MKWAEYRPGAAVYRRGWTVGLRLKMDGGPDDRDRRDAVKTFRAAYPAVEIDKWEDYRNLYVRFRSRQDAALFKLAAA